MRLLPHGREVTEAYGIEIEIEELFQGPQRLYRVLGDPNSRWTQPPGELVLQCVSYNDGPLLRQVEGDAAGRMPGKVDGSDFGPKWKDVAVLQPIVHGNGLSHEPGEHRLCHHGEQFVLQWTRGRHLALDDVRLQPMRSN